MIRVAKVIMNAGTAACGMRVFVTRNRDNRHCGDNTAVLLYHMQVNAARYPERAWVAPCAVKTLPYSWRSVTRCGNMTKCAMGPLLLVE